MTQRLSLKASIEKIVLLSFILAFACLLFFSFYSYGRLERGLAVGLSLITLYIIVNSTFSKKRRTEEKKIEKSRRLYATISQVNKSIIYAREPGDLLQRVCSVAVESGKFRMAWIGLLDKEQRVVAPVCRAGYGTEYLDEIKISIDNVPEGAGPTGTALREGRHYICNSIRTDPIMATWREEALKREYRSSIALPILKFGKPFGSFSLYSREENFFDEEEVSLLEEVVRDISFTLDNFAKEEQRLKAEKEIRTEKQFSDSIINMLPGVFYLYNEKHHFLRWNDQFEEISGYGHEEFAALSVLDFFKGSQRDLMQKKIEAVFVTGRCDVEAVLTTKGGEELQFYFTGTRVNFMETPCVLGLGFDISRLKDAENLLKQSEEDLRDLASNLQNVREEERTSISREIHDELGQQLTAIKLDVSWLDRKIQGDAIIKERIGGILSMLTEMIHTIRRISTQLRPSILDDLGLVEALRWQVRDFQKRGGIGIQFECPEESLKLEAGVTTGLFRIFQEALTNIARHAEATAVSAFLLKEDGQLVLTITDNGKGFDLHAAKKKKTLGLLGMKERTLMMKGAYEISSQPGSGTSLRVSVPLHMFGPPSTGSQ
ncbi:MAG TPA: GAF domain-containing protein [Puia sp.]|nr:GAF domain-containing protein [Puia sp.]